METAKTLCSKIITKKRFFNVETQTVSDNALLKLKRECEAMVSKLNNELSEKNHMIAGNGPLIHP